MREVKVGDWVLCRVCGVYQLYEVVLNGEKIKAYHIPISFFAVHKEAIEIIEIR